jgi:hypothetical protein
VTIALEKHPPRIIAIKALGGGYETCLATEIS